ncbi:MAG TPA: AsmA family protein [Burkholderiales bacterium]|nr:AsmA family protein [Burkholderiales bacterium]
MKILLYLVLGLVVLVVAAAAIFAVTFDPNRYKGDIQRIVKERTGRTLELKGPLELAFWPSLGTKVSGVVLSEHASPQPFVSLESAHASVALLPLLRGAVVVDRIRLSGLKAQIVKGKDGRFNFQDLIEQSADKPAAKAEKKAPDSGGGPVAFDIAGVTIERAALSYRDLNSGQEIAVNDLRLETGRIAENAEGKLEFATGLRRNAPPLDAKLSLNGRYALKPESVALDFTGKLDESTIKGKAAMARAKVAAYEFDLNIDKLNLDHYLASSEKKSSGAKEEPAKPAPKDKDKESDAPVDLSGLKGLNAKGKVEIGALQVQGLKLASVKTEIRAADGRAEVGPHSANLYEGSLSGNLTLDGNANRVAVKETLSNIAVGPLLRDFAQQDKLEGKGNVALDVNAAGKSVNAIKSALAGTAKVNLRDGAIKGVDIGAIINKARSTLNPQQAQATDGSKERTDFSELNATFAIKNGVAHNDDLDVKAPLFRVGGAGDIDVGKSTINYVVKATVVATTAGQGGKERDDLSGLTVPVKLSGPLDAMKYEVDYRAVAGDLAKSKVGGQAKEAIEKNRGKIEDQVKDRLKGLLGR